MALVGDRTAFIPIGLSGQVSWQLEQNRAFLSVLLGEPLADRPAFFDRAIISADAVADIIRHIVTQPIAHGSIDVPSVPFSAPMLSGHKIWFWLETTSHLMTEALLGATIAKYEHLRQEFLALAAMPRRIFVIGSGQNDILINYPYLTGGAIVDFTQPMIDELRQCLASLFPDGENHLLVVGKARAVAGVEGAQALPDEHTIWHGLTPDWRHALFAFLRADLPPLAADIASSGDTMAAVITDLMIEGQRLRWTQPPAAMEAPSPDDPAARLDDLHRRLIRACRERDALARRTAALEQRYAIAERLWRAMRFESPRHTLQRLSGRAPRR